MGNYIFLSRSNLSNATDLSAWHVEAIPLPVNMLKDQDRLVTNLDLYVHIAFWYTKGCFILGSGAFQRTQISLIFPKLGKKMAAPTVRKDHP